MRRYSNEQLAQLYPLRADYVAAVDRAAAKARSEGYLLAEDADRIRQQAGGFSIPGWH
jgi:hypothetical protein